MRTIKINYNETFASKHSRDYYRGKSFHFSGKWMQGTHYISDDYNIDFVVHGQTLLACAKSHLSTLENEPIDYIRDERGTIIGVVSAYWDFVVSGIIGKSPGIKIENNYWYTCEDTSVQNPIWINTGIKASLEYEDLTPEQIAELQRFAVELVNDFINNVIVQDEGQNTDKVMSQNAVTSALSGKVDNDLVPAEASSSNQLADKEWVDTNKQDTLVSGTNIQTINGHSILDSGNFDIQAEIKANEPFPETWNINSSLFNLVSDIRQDTDAVQGKVYLSTVYLNDLPAGMLQAEMKVEVLQSSGIGKVLRLTITSEDQSPYYWQCTAAYDRIGEWITFVPSDEAVQTPDWDQSDSSARDYIKNKPTNLSDFTDDLGSSPIHTHSQYDTAISGITEKIPNAASSSNQLADKNFVNSSIATSTATFRGTSATGLTEQEFLAWANALTKDDNDYIYWNTVDLVGNVQFKRYKYDGSAWVYEYTLNNSSFTADEWAAIQSRITSNLVTKLSELPTNANLNAALNNKVDKVSGKGLSTNDYTTEEKTKLSGIASGAQVNVLEGVQVDGTDLTITNKKVNVDLSGKTDVPESVTVDTSFTFRKTGDGLNIDAKNALIKGIKGRTDAWNQMIAQNGSSYQGNLGNEVLTPDGDYGVVVNYSAAYGGIKLSANVGLSVGHKYLYLVTYESQYSLRLVTANNTTTTLPSSGKTYNTIALSTNTSVQVYDPNSSGESRNFKVGLRLVDLTLAYGSGKEPSTVDAFLKDYPYAFGASYNAGKLLGNSVTGMETTGLNQWDEQYEGGTLDTSTGANAASSTRIRSKGYVQILPNTAYYLKSSATDTGTWRICYYDASKSFITGAFAYANQALSASPANAAFMRFSPSDAYGTTYKNDICINLSDASVNGTYEPYNRTRRELPITTATGKLNGTGASQVVFPNGLNGVGTSFDEIVVENGLAKKGIRRRARVDLGTLTWTYESGSSLMYAPLAGLADPGNPRRVPLACAKYVGVYNGGTFENTPDKSIFNRTAPNLGVMVKDSAYTDPAAFKTAMSGVMLDYQLATPQTFIFDTPFPVIYPVHANGTEEATPIGLDANGVPESTPFVGTIFYKEAFEDIYVQDLIVDKIAICTGTKNEFLKADGSLDDVTETGAQKNIIETIKVNNTALTPTNKTVNITVPTKTSDLTNDDNVVKDASYVHTDNNYTSAEKTKLSNALTTPTTVSKTNQSFAYRAIENGVIPTGVASIAKIKGRTDAWNQLGVALGANTDTSINPNTTRSDSFTITHNNTAATSSAFYYYGTQGIVVGHKYLVCMEVYADEALTLTAFGNNWAQIKNIAVTTTKQRFEFIYQFNSLTASAFLYFGIGAHATSGAKIYLSNAILVDLTLQYGAGREPATVAAFLAEYPEALTAPYNAGKLIPNKMTALVTTGFNQWDEQWEVGGYDTTTGAKDTSTNRIRSTNAIKVFPSTVYCCTGSSFTVFQYDINGAFIRTNSVASGGIFYTESNCYQIRFQAATAYGTTYKNDIAINLSHSGIRNGEYEPYWQSTLNLDHSKIYGKLNGAGEMVQIAPNGFRGVGTNCDEVDIVRKEAYIRLASIVLTGSETWIVGNNTWVCKNILSGCGPTGSAIICSKVGVFLANGQSYPEAISAPFSIGATAAAAAAFMAGAEVHYQLATPLHYTDLMYSEDGGQTFTEIPSNYRVDDFGTERRLPDGLVDGAPASSPLVADIVYNSTIIKDVNVGGILDYAKQTDVTRVANKKADKVLIDTTEPAGGMLPNTLYNFGTLSGNKTFTMATPVDNTVLNHWYWTFNVPSTVPTITWPNAITSWLGGSAPVISANKHYEISVLNGIAVYMEI